MKLFDDESFFSILGVVISIFMIIIAIQYAFSDKPMIENIKPTEGNVIVQRLKEQASDIIVTNEKDHGRAIVVHRGTATDFNEGDTVLCPTYAGTGISIEDKEYYIVKQDEIIAVYQTEKE